MRYPIAERFKATQGEGAHTGVPMAFIRTVGCSVGQKVCTACDTRFDRSYADLGGGTYTEQELAEWVSPYLHACITGGEPLDRDIRPLAFALNKAGVMVHVETSGTRVPPWLGPPLTVPGFRLIAKDNGDGTQAWLPCGFWVTVSPKPGWQPEMLQAADEVKVILGGLGDGPGWPDIAQAVAWANETFPHSRQRPVYVQQRNGINEIDREALDEALRVVDENPALRLSVQLHKFLRTR
jgi:organic radical activating enzyme